MKRTGEARATLASKMRQVAKEAAFRHRNVVRGIVLRPTPLKVELVSDDRVLDDDELDLTQWVKVYALRVGIKKGDEVVLMRENGEWTVTDVRSDSDVEVFLG